MEAAQARKDKIMAEREKKLQEAEFRRALAIVKKGDRSKCFSIVKQQLLQGQEGDFLAYNKMLLEYYEANPMAAANKTVEVKPVEEEKVREPSTEPQQSETTFIKPTPVFSAEAKHIVQKDNAVAWAIVNQGSSKYDPQSDSSDNDMNTI